MAVLWYYRLRRIRIVPILTLTRILDTLHLIFIAHALYYYLILNYANPMALPNIIWYVLFMWILLEFVLNV